jgi:hypothetical protein
MALLLQSLSATWLLPNVTWRKPQRNLFAIYQLYIVFPCRNCHRSLRSCEVLDGNRYQFIDIPLIEGLLITVLDTFLLFFNQ